MWSRVRALASLILFVFPAVFGLGCGEGRELSWSIRFDDPALAGEADGVFFTVLRGGCESTDVGWSAIAQPGVDPPRPTDLGLGRFGLVAVAVDQDCQVIAETGCDEIILADEVEAGFAQVLTARTELACVQPCEGACQSFCRGRLCGSPAEDAGEDSGADADGGSPDGGAGVACDTFSDCPSAANANSAMCVGGFCVPGCVSGFGDCDGDYLNGCEASVDSATNCGECGVSCNGPNLVGDCSAGECASSCVSGFLDCDGDSSNGCETDPSADADNCGACGVSCQTFGAAGGCNAGSCSFACMDGFSDCDGDPDNGCEVDIANDLSNCGSCGEACLAVGGAPACNAGLCEVGACGDGFGDCDVDPSNGCETNLSTSSNCGVCGTECEAGEVCDASGAMPTCTSGCPPGTTMCGASCIDTDTSAANCGACGEVCALPNSLPSCSGGSCQVSCVGGFEDCDGNSANGCETNVQSNVAACGACGESCDFDNGLAGCSAGSCVLTGCAIGFDDCDADPSNGCETNTRTDDDNCGGCSVECNLSNASASCSAGSCNIDSCTGAFANCDSNDANGCETNTDADPSNCGGCGAPCALANTATYTCAGGMCGVGSCQTGFGDCDGDPGNGCEQVLSSDDNCGACGETCASNETCSGGMCSEVMCPSGQADCDANGSCETTLATDANNCGVCGRACSLANATATCSSGQCEIASCNAGFGDCNGDASDGCEINTSSSTSNCGACGEQCSLPNSTTLCAGGSCVLGDCNGAFADCDGALGNGCETNTNNSITNCGACGDVCDLDNATSSCSGGSCSIGSCDAGFDDCDGDATNGCETDITTNTDCGACANACDAGADLFCNGSSCAQMCTAPFQDCSPSVPGCETNTNTSNANCGSCGNPCSYANGTGSCSGGSCGFTGCNTGFGNCDGNTGNGCETNINSSLNHCGTCNNVCSLPNANESCSAGTCSIGSCINNWRDCDGDTLNGCEINRSTNPNHCGGCNMPCNLDNVNTHTCNGGNCNVGSCDGGFGNCDGSSANGCETTLGTNSNCGSCGDTCNTGAGFTCQSGSCTMVMCSAPQADCDSNPLDCETNTNTSLSHCGGCNSPCVLPQANETCSGGSCSIASCQSPWENCDFIGSNGCEANTNTNLSHCGGCNQVCGSAHASPTCFAGNCNLNCDPEWGNCDGNEANGCEKLLFADNNNCGSCGNRCTGGRFCCDSRCVFNCL